MKFAKIFELENDEQVLLTVNYNEEDDSHELEIRSDIFGCIAKTTMGFDEEDQAYSALNKFDMNTAISVRSDFEKMLAE